MKPKPSWLDDFVAHTAPVSEAPLDVLWWVGVSTIAGALRRRVWIEQGTFQWVPNFYTIVVADPGIISKTTSANLGFNMLREVDGINFGPDSGSWQALLREMGKIGEEFQTQSGAHYSQSAMTVAIDEYGTFIDPFNREQIDNLTALWDGKPGTIWKATNTQGHDVVSYPWLNLFGCTTPKWLESNFPEAFLGSGFLSRHIFLFATEKRQLIPYPSKLTSTQQFAHSRGALVDRLRDIATYCGPYRMTPAAEEWGEEWYRQHWATHASASRERLGYPARKQTHLHKLAMVLSAAQGSYPVINASHLTEANERLGFVEPSIQRVLGLIGNTPMTRAAREIVEAVERVGKAVLKREIYRTCFFRRLSNKEFEEALAGAIGAGYIDQSADGTTLKLKRRLEHEGG